MARLLSGLDEDIFEITIVCFRIDDEDFLAKIPDYVEIVELDIEKKFQLSRLSPLLRILRTTDVLVCSMYYSSIVGTILGKITGVPAIFRWQHNTRIKNSTRLPLHQLTALLSDRVIADCEQSAETLRDELPLSVKNIDVLTLAGIDVESFPEPQQSDQAPIKVGTIGRLQEKKNLGAVIEVASHFEATDCRFYIVGTGPEREQLVKKASDVEAVELLGQLSSSELLEFLEEMDIYMQPSLSEGLCITVLEAMASGLPVVASPVGGISKSVIHAETGYLTDPTTALEYVDRIEELTESRDLRKKMGNSGRERITEYYSRKKLASDFTDFVYETLGA